MRTYQATEEPADRFPQAMIEGSSEFDWDELPDHLKDVLRGAARAVNEWAAQQENPIAGEIVPDVVTALPAAKQAYLSECENEQPGDQIWFSSLFEAEQVINPGSCCTLKPVGDDYDGPRFVPE